MDNFAPVLIGTLCRYDHFKRCVESLAACTHADKTDLYIAFDFPSLDSHWDGYKKIEQYITGIKGFRTVNIFKRPINYGINKNYFEAYDEIFEKYDRMIVSEDDNFFAPSFLTHVNRGLNVYENRADIFSVSGYNKPTPLPGWYKHDVYMIRGFAGWGVGMWREKWNKVDWSMDAYSSMLNKKNNDKELKKNYETYLPSLIKIQETGIIIGDIFILLYLIDKNMYSVWPVKSRVRNCGHDGSGVHGGYSEVYKNQEIYTGPDEGIFPFDLMPDKKLIDFNLKYLQLSFSQKMKRKIPISIKEKLKKIIGK